jgi:hypothetical protein
VVPAPAKFSNQACANRAQTASNKYTHNLRVNP